MGREKTRFGLYMIVGAYLIYLAYQIYQNPEADPRPMALYLFMIVFLVTGIGLLIFGGWLLYQNVKHPQVDDTPEEGREETAEDGAKSEGNETEHETEDAQGAVSQADSQEKV